MPSWRSACGARACGSTARRIRGGRGAANFKKAMRWLTLAGEQGLAEAWYALSRIYIKPEFSQRNVVEAQKYLERAAEMGYRDAQLECGNAAWRARRENENNDVRARVLAAEGGRAGLRQGGGRAAQDRAAHAGRPGRTRRAGGRARPGGHHPLLAARLELAAVFGLSRAEALLLDIRQADHGHCLVVDIRASYGRSRRRLVLVDTAQERQALDRVARLFESVDCGPGGPEGNYRQRLYRLKTWCRSWRAEDDDDGGVEHGHDARDERSSAWPRGCRCSTVQTSISPSNTVTAGPVR